MLAIALSLLTAGGLYLRHRLGDALATLGVGPRPIRWTRAAVVWLLFGYPLLMVVTVVVTLVTGRETLPSYEGPIGTWLLLYPFFLAALVLAQSLPWLGLIELVRWAVRRRRGAAAAARLRAIAVLVVLAGFALYTPLRIVLERDALRVRHHQLGDGARQFRIVFIADLQQDDHTDAAQAARAVGLANAAAPDLILGGGDWINTGPDHIAAAAASAGALRSRLGTFSVRGDHEHFAYVDRDRSVREVEQALAANGVAMLRNQVRWFEHAGRRIGVLFLEYNYLVRTAPAAIDALVAQLADADYAIVVTHQLDATVAARVKDKVDLVLAGHTHGGQINPVLGVVHVSAARVETPYVDGRYQLGSTTIIVTAGIGYSLVPFRYASPGSIEVIDLRW